MTGLRRNLEERVNRLLEVFPVVMLLGARQTGKTTLSRMVRPDWRYVDLENAADHDLVTRDYDFFFREHPRHVIIDEAQEDPRLFRQLRGVVDAVRGESGRFLLTGSSSPDLFREAGDSLAGRIAIVEVGTLKINEIARLPLPPFYRLLERELTRETLKDIRELDCPVPDVIPCFLRGGYPEPTLAADDFVYDHHSAGHPRHLSSLQRPFRISPPQRQVEADRYDHGGQHEPPRRPSYYYLAGYQISGDERVFGVLKPGRRRWEGPCPGSSESTARESATERYQIYADQQFDHVCPAF